jgi:uncharacterized SAM-dependent methyltransferase
MGLPSINIQSFVSNPLVVVDDLTLEVLGGLHQERKTLPSKLFYDQRGSLVFDQICKLYEYYPTRTETAIMQRMNPWERRWRLSCMIGGMCSCHW